MPVKITQIKGWELKAEADGFTVISGKPELDRPAEGMSPGTLMAASLGLCTGMHLVSYMQKNNIENDGFEINVETVSGKNPNRCTNFTTNIKLNACLSEEQKKGFSKRLENAMSETPLRPLQASTSNCNATEHQPLFDAPIFFKTYSTIIDQNAKYRSPFRLVSNSLEH